MILTFLTLAVVTILDALNPLLMLIAPFITQFIKNQLKLEGNGAILLALVIAVALAVFGAWATGALAIGWTFALFSEIFTVATVIYKMIIKDDSVQAVLPNSLK